MPSPSSSLPPSHSPDSISSDHPPDRSKVQDLVSRIPPGGTRDPDQMLDLFLGWVFDIGFEL